jgi:hypothetical protein
MISPGMNTVVTEHFTKQIAATVHHGWLSGECVHRADHPIDLDNDHVIIHDQPKKTVKLALRMRTLSRSPTAAFNVLRDSYMISRYVSGGRKVST